MEVFFNELSVRSTSSDAEAKQWVETLADLLQALQQTVESISENQFTLRRSEDFGMLRITTTHTIFEFMSEHYDFSDKEYGLLISLFDSPYITENDPERNEFEYTSLTFAGKDHNITGLAAAHLKNALGISFDSDIIWNTCHYTTQINRLNATHTVVSSLETIAHASQKQHLINCHLPHLARLFNWASYHPQPTVKGLLPLISVFSLHVESWESFYYNLSQLATGERVHEIIKMAQHIADIQRWIPAVGSLKSRNPSRTIYTILNSNLIVSVDTQHGEFEIFNRGGSNHVGALSFDGKRIKESDSQRYLNN